MARAMPVQKVAEGLARTRVGKRRVCAMTGAPLRLKFKRR
jgi:hypothetical protein